LIPVNEPWITNDDRQAMAACVDAGWLSSSGPQIGEFERRWADYCGRAHGVAVVNGTAALQLAVAALDLPRESEVILPTFTIISCAVAVVQNGAKPVLVDSDPRTGGMNVEDIERSISPRTRAIMPVHIYGHPVDMDPVLALAEEYGLAVIEDAAEAHGAEYLSNRAGSHGGWKRCGAFGDMACFSFYANKLITTGEGGMVITDKPELAERLRSLRNLCFEPANRFHHEDLGFNYRLTSPQAALALPQIARIEAIIERKRSIARMYSQRLGELDWLELPIEEPWARSVYWMYAVRLRPEAGIDAATVADRLRLRGVETRPFFIGMHAQPALRKRGLFAGQSFPVADALSRYGFYLPSGLALTEAQIETATAALKEVLE
jgi:perosamine synthetase